jgi:hypothetical protein
MSDETIATAETTETTTEEAPATETQTEEAPAVEGILDESTTDEPSSTENEGTDEATDEVALTVPEGSNLSQEAVDAINTFAKENGLSQEQAEALMSRETEASERVLESLEREQEQEQAKWVENVKKDAELGGANFDQTKDLARKVVLRFGSDELMSNLKSTGLGNYPEFVRLLVRVGKAISDDTLVSGKMNPSPAKKSDSDAFYGNSED